MRTFLYRSVLDEKDLMIPFIPGWSEILLVYGRKLVKQVGSGGDEWSSREYSIYQWPVLERKVLLITSQK